MENRTNIDNRYDAVVVGARVAGAATAMLLARAGVRVLAVDKSRYGSDTTSTHALMRAGVMQLRRWGVLDRIVAAGTPAIRRTTFHYADEAIEVNIQERDGVDALYAPRRTVLDAALADAAVESGAHVAFGVHFDGVTHDDAGRTTGVTLTEKGGGAFHVDAGMVIGADGLNSRVARAAGARVLYEGSHPDSVIYGYFTGTGIDATHWLYGDRVAAGAIPTNDGAACVFAAMPPERYQTLRDVGPKRLFMDVIREASPWLAGCMRRGERAGNFHPFAGHPGVIRRSWGPGWALVGDAGCFKDPITAHGITDALRDAELLARAVVAGGDAALERYQSERDDFAVEFMQLSDRIASFDWTLEEVKPMHRRLSRLMNAECDVVRAFGADGVPSRAV